MTDQDYGKLVNKKSKPSPMWKNMLWAFVVGGLICCIGQGFQEWYQSMGLSKTDAGTAVTITLVLLSALLTGLDLYEKLAKHAGAGTLVPVTGFAKWWRRPWSSRVRGSSPVWRPRCLPSPDR